jgi:hypothetical protein
MRAWLTLQGPMNIQEGRKAVMRQIENSLKLGCNVCTRLEPHKGC